ncbi:30S ribosomal protein S1 [Desulfogranum mediterraneum]|uniref:30S ribosomal protein S1 n=1 Tax=Desulfogranum mediterraneum TaxID=160661 RepID=UPI00040A468F|nr:30S ribosomal protein S1 [Desulfogranum mediterraneum]
MSDEKFTDLFQAKAVTRPSLKPGDRVQAVIAAINGESIFLDVGVKSEGILNSGELRNDEGEIPHAVGDTIEVFLLSARGGEMVFTTKIGSGQASAEELENAFHAGIPVEGKVTGEVKGGFSVQVAGQRGFCPYSQMGIRRVDEPELYLEQTLSFKIIEFGNRGKNIILSARAILEEQRALEREKLVETLEEGMTVNGTVTSIRDFGAFVDIGGVDGLIPISELAWGQTDKVEDVVQLGQEVEVMVKRLDWESDKISLSLRAALANPWDEVGEKYPLGSTHLGRVSRLADFGAFITLEPGIDGLLHISKLGSGRRINHPREVLEAGQELTIKIDAIDQDQQRISLVPADYTEKEQREERYTPPPADSTPKSMGTLGDLLKAQINKKK